jgi:hypothetical protein
MTDSDRYEQAQDNAPSDALREMSQADGMVDDGQHNGTFPKSEQSDRDVPRRGREAIGRLASDGLSRSKAFLDDLDGEAVVSRAKGFLKDHPGAAMLGVAAIGFLLGRGLKRNL